jgi:hypothetical protein
LDKAGSSSGSIINHSESDTRRESIPRQEFDPIRVEGF